MKRKSKLPKLPPELLPELALLSAAAEVGGLLRGGRTTSADVLPPLTFTTLPRPYPVAISYVDGAPYCPHCGGPMVAGSCTWLDTPQCPAPAEDAPTVVNVPPDVARELRADGIPSLLIAMVERLNSRK